MYRRVHAAKRLVAIGLRDHRSSSRIDGRAVEADVRGVRQGVAQVGGEAKGQVQGLIDSAAELVAEWSKMDEDEQAFQRESVIPIWEKRNLLGQLYCTGRLPPDQVSRLADLDKARLKVSHRPYLTRAVHCGDTVQPAKGGHRQR